MGPQTVATLTMNWSWLSTVIPMEMIYSHQDYLPSYSWAIICNCSWAVRVYKQCSSRSWCEISTEHCTKLVGIGTDEASANIAKEGLKGLIEEKLEWIFWMWCLAHGLELAVKDAMKSTFFDSTASQTLLPI